MVDAPMESPDGVAPKPLCLRGQPPERPVHSTIRHRRHLPGKSSRAGGARLRDLPLQMRWVVVTGVVVIGIGLVVSRSGAGGGRGGSRMPLVPGMGRAHETDRRRIGSALPNAESAVQILMGYLLYFRKDDERQSITRWIDWWC